MPSCPVQSVLSLVLCIGPTPLHFQNICVYRVKTSEARRVCVNLTFMRSFDVYYMMMHSNICEYSTGIRILSIHIRIVSG